jgi:hypothetical protein
VPTVDIDRDAAHEAAERELSKPIYPRTTLTQRFGDWLDELIFRIAEKASTVPGGWFTIAVLVLVVAVAAVLAVRIARRTMRTNRGGDHTLFGAAEHSAAEHRATAEQFAAQGDWAAAIRHRLRAVARQLEESGVLDPVPGRTSYELARAAGASIPALSGEFISAATVFNDVAFGNRAGTAVTYRVIADLDEHLSTRRDTPGLGSPVAPDETWAAVP